VIVPDGQRTSFLATQSVAALPIEADTHHRLWQLGIKTLGNVAKLPEEALVSQFGSEGRRAWLLASGITDDPVVGRPRPEPIVAALDYLTPVADRGMLAHAVGLLIDRALEHPRRTGWRVHTARVQATLENGASWMVEATLKDPSADRERIAAPLRARLETSPPVGAVDHLAVEFTEFARGTDELQLFARDAQSSARAGRRCALRAAVVPHSRASLRVDRLRALNLPLRVEVELDKQGLPQVVRQRSEESGSTSPPTGGWGRRVEEVLEIWRVDDEWWRRPITRRYVEVLLEGGGHVVLFEDLVTREWFLQKP
jgi:hypothetical protein